MLFERLKTILGKMRLPAGTRGAVAAAGSTADLARRLDGLITENEVEFRNLQRDIEELERRESEETGKIRSGKLGSRSRKVALMHIQRLRRQQDALESRMRIHDNNMNLHIGLLGKIQSLEAMEMRGLEEEEIDTVALEFQEEFERYSSAVEAGAAATRDLSFDDEARDGELAALEAEITGGREPEREAGRSQAGEPSRGAPAAAVDDPGREARREPGPETTRDDGEKKEAAWD